MSLICSLCNSLLKNPVTMPCCRKLLCRACAFRGLTRNGKKCWFLGCERTKISYDELRICEKTKQLLADNIVHKQLLADKAADSKLLSADNIVHKQLLLNNKASMELLADNMKSKQLISDNKDTKQGNKKTMQLMEENKDELGNDISINKLKVREKTEQLITEKRESKKLLADIKITKQLLAENVDKSRNVQKSNSNARDAGSGLVSFKDCGTNITDSPDLLPSSCVQPAVNFNDNMPQSSGSPSPQDAIADINVDVQDKTERLSCQICEKSCRNITFLKNHLVSHFYQTFYKVLPDCKPYPCPECGHEHRDRVSLARHFALAHNKIFELTHIKQDDFPFSISLTKTADKPKKYVPAGSRNCFDNLVPKINVSCKTSDELRNRIENLYEIQGTGGQLTIPKLPKVMETKENTGEERSSVDTVGNVSNLLCRSGIEDYGKEPIINKESEPICDNEDFNIFEWKIIDEWNDQSDIDTVEKVNCDIAGSSCIDVVGDDIAKEIGKGGDNCEAKILFETKKDSYASLILSESFVEDIKNVRSETEMSVHKSNDYEEISSNNVSDINALPNPNPKLSDYRGVNAPDTILETEESDKTIKKITVLTDIQPKNEIGNRCCNITSGLQEIAQHLVEVTASEVPLTKQVSSIDSLVRKSALMDPSEYLVPSAKQESLDNSILPPGLYGLLFLDVEILLDGQQKTSQITQLGCTTYFSNGEHWSDYFSAVLPNCMELYRNHPNPVVLTNLMLQMRMTSLNEKTYFNSSDGSSVQCVDEIQAKQQFREYVMRLSEIVDGVVIVLVKSAHVLPFILSLQFASEATSTLFGMIDLYDLFSDTFPHLDSLGNVSSIYNIIFSDNSLPNFMNCAQKSQILYDITEKLLSGVDYYNFVLPYGKSIIGGAAAQPNMDHLETSELKLTGSFNSEIGTVISISCQTPQSESYLSNMVLKSEKLNAQSCQSGDARENCTESSRKIEEMKEGKPNTNCKLKDKNTQKFKHEPMKVEPELDSVEYVEPEHSWGNMEQLKSDQHSKSDTSSSLLCAQNIGKEMQQMNAAGNSTPEPRGQIDYFDTEDEYDINSDADFGASPSKRSITKLQVSNNLTYSDVIVPTGPVCLCDKFTLSERGSTVSADLADLCKECRSCQVKTVCLLKSSGKVKTILARVEDGDGIVANKCVKFLPSPFLLHEDKPVPYSQVRKVYLNNYILLCIEGNPNMTLDVEKDGLVGLCQVWLGTKVDDLDYYDDIKLICEDIKIDDDGSLMLLCSTELVLKRPVPLMVSNISQYLHIKPVQRIVTASRTGMVSVTCSSGTTGYLPAIGDDVGTVTTDVDKDLIGQIIKIMKTPLAPHQVQKRKTVSNQKPPPKKLKLISATPSNVSPQSVLETLQSIKTKHSLVTKPLKFGIKKAFKASPLIRAKVFSDQSNNSSDEGSSSPSPPPLSPELPLRNLSPVPNFPSIPSMPPFKGPITSKKPCVKTNLTGILSIGPGIVQPSILDRPIVLNPLNKMLPPSGQKIPTVINRQKQLNSIEPSLVSCKMETVVLIPPSIPVFGLPLPLASKAISVNSIPVCLPTKFPTYQQSPPKPVPYPCNTMPPPSVLAFSLPKPIPAACNKCIFKSLQSMILRPCTSCPTFPLQLNSDLTLIPDKPTFSQVMLEGVCVEQGKDVQKFAKIYTSQCGTLFMPQSLNMVSSDNPNPIPKPFIDGAVTVTFLNTISSPVPLKKGQTVGRGQVIYIKN